MWKDSHKALLTLVIFFMAAVPTALAQFFDLPPLPEPWEYGNVQITRQQETNTEAPVTFSHWSHRRRHTCRVCHFELGFAVETNGTEITEQGNVAGEFCGNCHNGEDAFAHTRDNCARCHGAPPSELRERFAELSNLPHAPYGNEIDWNRAIVEELIDPAPSLFDEDYEAVEFEDELDIDAKWSLIPPAEFPHEKHKQWLDCGDCHPGIFNVAVNTTSQFRMRHILEGRFCGVCHLDVAFPLNDCKRCHPAMRR